MMNAVIFEPQIDGKLFVEWKLKGKGYAHARIDLARLSKASFKRLICWIVESGEWYLDYSIDAYGEEYAFGTCTAKCEGLERLEPGRIVRWLVSVR